MNEELTREVLEAMVKCDTICSRCKAVKLCSEGIFNTLRILATALLAEMDKPKVWDGAPEDAVSAVVTWCRSGEIVGSVSYNREIPKTRARQMAEEIEKALSASPRYKTEVEIIESALTKYAEELEGKE